MSDPNFLRRTPRGVTVELRVQPRARRNHLAFSPSGLRVAVTAVPEDGKANDAVIALLAEAWRLPKTDFVVVKGATARAKVLAVCGDPRGLAGRIAEWAEAHG